MFSKTVIWFSRVIVQLSEFTFQCGFVSDFAHFLPKTLLPLLLVTFHSGGLLTELLYCDGAYVPQDSNDLVMEMGVFDQLYQSNLTADIFQVPLTLSCPVLSDVLWFYDYGVSCFKKKKKCLHIIVYSVTCCQELTWKEESTHLIQLKWNTARWCDHYGFLLWKYVLPWFIAHPALGFVNVPYYPEI